MKYFLFLILSFLSFQISATPKEITSSSNLVFFPAEAREQARELFSLPFKHWNFLIFKMKPESKSDSVFCRTLADSLKSFNLKLGCLPPWEIWRQEAVEWAQDVPLRKPLFKDWKTRLEETRVKIAYAPDPELRGFLQLDPFGTYADWLASNPSANISADEDRIFIPLQFSHDANETAVTKELSREIDEFCKKANSQCSEWTGLGAHFASLRNESQIRDDLSRVGWWGGLALFILFILLVMKRMHKLFFLVPPVVIGVLISGEITKLIFGSMHGLCLAFGVGLVGLCLDFGLHGIYSSREQRSVWTANFLGLATSLVVLVILIFSEIPLFQQLGVFSSIGLCVGYVICYLMHRWKPDWFRHRPMQFHERAVKFRISVVTILSLIGMVGLFFANFHLDLEKMEFRTPKEQAAIEWLKTKTDMGRPFFLLHRENEAPVFKDIKGLKLRELLPPPDLQRENLKTWSNFCDQKATVQKADLLFGDYFRSLNCKIREGSPAYLSSFRSEDGNYADIYFPANEIETKTVLAGGGVSLKELAEKIPARIKSEMKWMIPLSISLIFIFLWIAFQSAMLASISFIPLSTGLGAVFLAQGGELSLVSLVGCFMLCGFSIDYGIFVAHLIKHRQGHAKDGVMTSIFLSALANCFGFAPLIFCTHPVLRDLGLTLTFGSLGAYLGSGWLRGWGPMKGLNT